MDIAALKAVKNATYGGFLPKDSPDKLDLRFVFSMDTMKRERSGPFRAYDASCLQLVKNRPG